MGCMPAAHLATEPQTTQLARLYPPQALLAAAIASVLPMTHAWGLEGSPWGVPPHCPSNKPTNPVHYLRLQDMYCSRWLLSFACQSSATTITEASHKLYALTLTSHSSKAFQYEGNGCIDLLMCLTQ